MALAPGGRQCLNTINTWRKQLLCCCFGSIEKVDCVGPREMCRRRRRRVHFKFCFSNIIFERESRSQCYKTNFEEIKNWEKFLPMHEPTQNSKTMLFLNKIKLCKIVNCFLSFHLRVKSRFFFLQKKFYNINHWPQTSWQFWFGEITKIYKWIIFKRLVGIFFRRSIWQIIFLFDNSCKKT